MRVYVCVCLHVHACMLQSCTLRVHACATTPPHTYMYVHRMLGPSQALLDECKDDIQQLKVCKNST
jgi:hypothetical protein